MSLEKFVRPIVVYEFSESLLGDPDGTFLYYTTVGFRHIHRRFCIGNPTSYVCAGTLWIECILKLWDKFLDSFNKFLIILELKIILTFPKQPQNFLRFKKVTFKYSRVFP